MRQIYDEPLAPDWCEAPLKNVSRRARGYSWDKAQEIHRAEPGSIPVIRIPNVGDRLDLSDLLHLRDVSLEDRLGFAVRKDWILFVASNGNPDRIGDSVLVDRDEEMLFASFLQGITSKDTAQLLPAYLAQWLRLERVHDTFSETSQQTTGLANFSWSAVKNLPIRFPRTLSDQQKIIDALSRIEDVRLKSLVEIETTNTLKSSLLEQLFTYGVSEESRDICGTKWLRCPASWDRKRLRSVADVQAGFTMGRDLIGNELVDVPYLTVVNVQEGSLALDAVSSVSLKKTEVEGALLKAGDILVTEGGDRDKLGRGSIWSEEVNPCAYQNHIFRVRFCDEGIDPWWFHYLLQTQQSKRYFFAHAKQTSNLCTINSRELKRFEVPVPSLDEQLRIVSVLKCCDDLLAATSKRIIADREMHSSLRKSLLGGSLSIREAALT